MNTKLHSFVGRKPEYSFGSTVQKPSGTIASVGAGVSAADQDIYSGVKRAIHGGSVKETAAHKDGQIT